MDVVQALLKIDENIKIKPFLAKSESKNEVKTKLKTGIITPQAVDPKTLIAKTESATSTNKTSNILSRIYQPLF